MKWLSLLLIFFSCNTMKAPLTNSTSKNAQVSIHDIYVLESLEGEDVEGKMKKSSTLEINLTDMRMMGNDGCNDFGGQINHHDATKMEITFDEIIATEMYCDEWSNKVGNSFYKVKKYKRDGMQLQLLDGQNKVLLTYKKVD